MRATTRILVDLHETHACLTIFFIELYTKFHEYQTYGLDPVPFYLTH